MNNVELTPSYDHHRFEDRIYTMWKERGYFAPAAPEDSPQEEASFAIVIPPPNVTGILHMGHGLNNTLQDLLVRYHRMMGRPTLWVPGTDHAGIATQNVMDRRLEQQGQTRRGLGRARFAEETWRLKREHHAIITRQLEKLGASCDWSRERFTLDEGLSRAVVEVFVTLHEQGLLYRGNYLINWCPSCGTALSDEEVEHRETVGRLYHYRYPLEGGGSIEIATTRPETMLGDTAIVVHPEDERYSALVGAHAHLPLTDRTIPIVADGYIDREFGTGALKLTPAHDPNDWEIAKRHGLTIIDIITPNGRLNDAVPPRYRGLSIAEARRRVVADLKEAGLFVGDRAHHHQVGHCYRCDTVIEPRLSEQWFVKMRPLADEALAVWKRGEVRFHPRRWEKTYCEWLTNIRDWCISRQLWWGHRLPVWYDDETGETIISRDDPTLRPENAGRTLRRDEDVLDTWFSSWLWPFSTLGWPEATVDMDRFFPTTALITGYDIIFFWVSRMIMASTHFLSSAPFQDVYLTGLIRDKRGRKMSKSLGNGIDPIEIVEAFGADTLKFSLAYLTTSSQDILLDKKDFHIGSRFVNKIWNSARFILLHLEGRTLHTPQESGQDGDDFGRWIGHRLNETAETVHRSLSDYRFSDACHAVYEYYWNDFCDWYLEAVKLMLRGGDERDRDRIVTTLLARFEESLRLLHPFVSFVSEELYRHLSEAAPTIAEAESLMIAPYPRFDEARREAALAGHFASLQELVGSVRSLRSQFAIAPHVGIGMAVRFEPGFGASDFIRRHADIVERLVGASSAVFGFDGAPPPDSISVAGPGFEACLAVRPLIDEGELLGRLCRQRDRMQKLLDTTLRRLNSEGFLRNATEAIQAHEARKAEEFGRQLSLLARYITELSAE